MAKNTMLTKAITSWVKIAMAHLIILPGRPLKADWRGCPPGTVYFGAGYSEKLN